ncbi:AIG_G0004870.mRNA.1.CDS.1 [Saccharomyces cerevisiae]|nr:AIG_G0004870.mRNA.1.CDS.1 [Saccharomyces cerevisiae]CAI6511939.1 AIG_G0004870.mRNA.1.CDS.1 [Saccharomyces cerevisiae]
MFIDRYVVHVYQGQEIGQIISRNGLLKSMRNVDVKNNYEIIKKFGKNSKEMKDFLKESPYFLEIIRELPCHGRKISPMLDLLSRC